MFCVLGFCIRKCAGDQGSSSSSTTYISVATDGGDTKRRRIRARIDEILIAPSWLRWSTPFDAIRIYTDCQAVSRLLTGQAALQSETYRMPLRRTLRSLEQILSSRWTLADPSEPAIQWIPRHRNQLADFLSTQTLAKRESWSHCFCPQLHGKRCNLVLFVDGGVRSGKSASAWLIAASTPQHAFFVFRAGGIFWQDSAMTPFAAEVGAMEVGLHELACSVASLSCELAR